MKEERDKYCGPITVTLAMPAVQFLKLSTVDCSKSNKILNASDRRCFNLIDDWHIDLDKISYQSSLNGRIKIPHEIDGKKIDFDGASVPASAAWLASFLSLGIVRPMGVMLCASIVHDFTYQYGYLLVSKGDDQPFEKVEITRCVADKLFRDMVSTIHGLSIFGWLSWFLLKVGWIAGTEYKYSRWEKPFPITAIATLITVSSLPIIYLFGGDGFEVQRFKDMISYTFMSLVIVYSIMSILKTLNKSTINKSTTNKHIDKSIN